MQSSERILPAIVTVETGVGSGVFAPDPRLCAVSVSQVVDPSKCGAVIAINPTDLDGTVSAWPDLVEYLGADRRVGIYLEESSSEGGLADRIWLFDGYPVITELHWGGTPDRTSQSVTLRCESVVNRLSDHPDAQIVGIKMPIERQSTAEPLADDAITDVASVPLHFNPDGRPNRSPAHGTKDEVELPLFCDPGEQNEGDGVQSGDPDAKYWTVAAAIRYLLWHFPDDLPFEDGNIATLTEDQWDSDPDDEIDTWSLRAALGSRCPSIPIGDGDVLEALRKLCGACGLRIAAKCVGTGTVPSTKLYIWSAGDGGVRESVDSTAPDTVTLKLDKAGAHYKRLSDGLEQNALHQGHILFDAGHVTNQPMVVGSPERWEVTCELMPGWLADDHWDVESAGAEDAILNVNLPGEEDPETAWFSRYCRAGASFAGYADVGRKWVLNEHGWYKPADYARSSGPFNDYAPFDFAAKCAPPGAETFSLASAWARRARPMLPCISRTPGKDTLGIYVEMSLDSGNDWRRIEGPIRVSRDEFAIVLEHDNLASIVYEGGEPADDNYVYAYIRGTLRLRVTSTVESDDRLRYDFPVNLSMSCTDLPRASLVRASGRYRRWSNAAANSQVEPLTGLYRRDDFKAMTAHARRVYRSASPRRVTLSGALPWIDTGLELGRTVDAIRPRGIELAGSPGGEGPEIVAIEYDFAANSTRLQTEDTRLL